MHTSSHGRVERIFAALASEAGATDRTIETIHLERRPKAVHKVSKIDRLML
jgi:hypothetical protein